MSALAAITTTIVAASAFASQRLDSRDQTRPYVTVAFRPGPTFSHGILHLVTTNIGRTPARDVGVVFTPEIPPNGGHGLSPFIRRRYRDRTPVLAPDEVMANVYMHVPKSATEGMPLTLRARVSYRDARDRWYYDTFDLRVDRHAEGTSSTPSGSNLEKRGVEAAEAAVWESWSSR